MVLVVQIIVVRCCITIMYFVMSRQNTDDENTCDFQSAHHDLYLCAWVVVFLGDITENGVSVNNVLKKIVNFNFKRTGSLLHVVIEVVHV